MRLIDADALKDALGDTRDGEPIFRPTEFLSMDIIEKAIDEAPTIERPHGKWIKEWKEVPITGGIMHQPYWSCPRCGRKWEAYSAQFITFCSKCGMELIDGDCEDSDTE